MDRYDKNKPKERASDTTIEALHKPLRAKADGLFKKDLAKSIKETGDKYKR